MTTWQVDDPERDDCRPLHWAQNGNAAINYGHGASCSSYHDSILTASVSAFASVQETDSFFSAHLVHLLATQRPERKHSPDGRIMDIARLRVITELYW